MPDAVEKLLVKRSLKPPQKAKQLAWPGGNSSDAKEVDDLLKSGGMTIDDVHARALELKFESIDGLDRLITSAEIRRSASLREIELHRDRKQFGQALRAQITKIEDSESETITTAPQQPPSKPSLLPP
jgi:hypothetical protein